MNYSTVDDNLKELKTYLSDSKQTLNWPSIFILPQWMEVWWQVFGSEYETMIQTFWDGDKVLGIAPLMVKDRQAALIGDTDVCDYLDFIISPGLEADFFHLLLDDLKKKGIRILNLQHLRPESAIITQLREAAESRGCQVSLFRDAVSLELDLPVDWDGYLALLDGKQRHEVRRKMRRLSEKGAVDFSFIQKKEEIPAAMDVFFRMFVDSRKDKATFMTEKMKSFFILLSEAMAKTGLLKIGFLTLEKMPVSAIMCFDYQGRIYLYNSGYDPSYLSLSAGLICKVLAIKKSIEEGKKKFDFLKGSETYKYHLGGQEVPLYRCQINIS